MDGPNGDTVPSGREPVTPPGAPESSIAAPQTEPLPAIGAAPPPPPKRSRRRLVFVSLGVVVVLVAGVLVWMFLLSGTAPTDLRVTDSTFASVTIEWAWEEDSAPTGFVVLRDGVEVARLGGSETTFEDIGVVPATEYGYEVYAELDGDRSEPAEVAATTTGIPAPSNLRASEETFESLALTWDWNEVPPDEFVVSRDGVERVRVTGQELGFLDAGLEPNTTYRYTVAAAVGDATGEPSAELEATTPEIPPLSEAEFSGTYSVRVRFTAANNYPSIRIGRGGNTTPWTFQQRASGPKVTAFFFPPPAGGWTMNMQGSGLTFRDTARASQSTCGGVPVVDTIDVVVRIQRAAVRGGQWVVTKWSGTLKLDSPQANSGIISCPSGSISADLTGNLQ